MNKAAGKSSRKSARSTRRSSGLPRGESARLSALRRLQVMDTPPEETFDGLVRLAAKICNTPIALISLVDETRQWFKARVGLDARETPREYAFCAHAIKKPGELLVIADASRDRRFAANPLVTGEPAIRFYAGAPLVTRSGAALGTLCVMDHVPRELRPEQSEALRDLASRAIAEMELRASRDEFAGRYRQTLITVAGERAQMAADRRQADERAMTASQARERDLRRIMDAVPTLISRLDRDERFLYVNQGYARMMERPAGEIVGRTLREVVDAGTYALAKPHIAAVLAGQTRQFEREQQRSDGSVQTVAVSYVPDLNSSGGVGGWFGFHRDITQERVALARLGESEARFRTLTEWSPEAIVVHRGGKLIYVNPAAIKLLGADSAEDLIGKAMLDLVHPDSRALARSRLRNLAQGGARNPAAEMKFLKCDGTAIHAEIQGTSLSYDGAPAIHVSLHDISERKRAEASLQAAEHRLRVAIDSLGESVVLTDADDRFVIVNRAFRELNANVAGLLEPGKRFEDYLRAGLAAGNYPDAAGHEAQWLEERLAERRDPQGPVERQRPGGRWFRVHDQRLADGGMIRVGVEITNLKSATQRLETALVGGSVSIWDTDLASGEVWLSEGWADLIGAPPGQTRTTVTQLMALVHPDELPEIVRLSEEALRGVRPFYTEEHRVRTRSGEWRWILSRGHVTARDAQGRSLRMAGTNVDITERKRMERQLTWSEDRFRSLLQFSFDVYWETDAQHRFTRQEFNHNLADAPPPGAEIGKTRWEIPYLEPDEDAWRTHRASMDAHLSFRDFELARPAADGGARHVSVSGMPVFDEYGEFVGYRGVGRHTTEQKRAEANLVRLANFDSLTGLPNRRLFQDRLGQALLQARRHQSQVCVLLLDLDHFKRVNDSFGHTAGDELLVAVATRLQSCLRAVDTLARLGGDEFAVVLANPEPGDAARVVAQKMLDSLGGALSLGGREVFASASIGISVFPQDAGEPDTLVRNADSALYKAKDAGRNGYQFFTLSMNEDAGSQLTLENDLRNAYVAGDFELYYQPKTDVSLARVTGVEALLRWRRRDGTFMSPAQFVPVLESIGLIADVGDWVLREACRQMSAWQRSFPHWLSVAVNVSARQFLRAGLVESVQRILAETGCSPQRLELEITESSLMQDIGATVTTLKQLRAIGVRIAIDDFGTGYSSLSYLKQLPIDTLKIDRSFIVDLAVNPDDAAITTAIVGMARSLGYRTVAEGVETPAQLRFLASCGCDEIQGYLLSWPLPADALVAWLEGRVAAD